jgi:predicted transcriptional regulator
MLRKGTYKELEKIKNVLEEHLSSINDNTSEIQSLFDYLQEVENKIDRLSQRLDQVQLSNNSEEEHEKPTITPLDHTERKVFLALYTEEMPLSYREIAERALVPSSVVSDCLSSLATKGIPILRSFCNNQLFIKLSPSFKERQAKENLINLSLHSFM